MPWQAASSCQRSGGTGWIGSAFRSIPATRSLLTLAPSVRRLARSPRSGRGRSSIGAREAGTVLKSATGSVYPPGSPRARRCALSPRERGARPRRELGVAGRPPDADERETPVGARDLTHL